MELWEEIICCIVKKEIKNNNAKSLSNMRRLFDTECYKALQRIKEIIEEDALDDANCFERIEEIVRVYEEMGSNGGGRHDFG